MAANCDRQPTLLLMGCTGAGKTPLGELLERRGLNGKPCSHLDFGARLRAVVRGDITIDGVAAGHVSEILDSARLLENEEFILAERIVAHFIAGAGMRKDDLLLLNGLPRHVSQAEDVDRMLAVAGVVYLHCDARTAYERIRLNTGGDRTGRSDDSEADIEKKLEIFDRRTIPLLDHYRGKGVSIVRIEVTVESTAAEVLGELERKSER